MQKRSSNCWPTKSNKDFSPKKTPQCGVFFGLKRITSQELLQEQQAQLEQLERQQLEQRQQEQQQVLVLVQELVLLFYRKRPKQQQRSRRPKRGIYSWLFSLK